MAERIKGITVEIGGDTQGLDNALKDVNDSGRKLQSELGEVQRLLKFNPENVELLAQRQTLLNRQIENTSEKLNRLKSVEAQVARQFENNEIGEEQFRAFQREIIATEGRLRHFERQAEGTARDVKGTFKDMGSGIASGIAGAAAGVGIGAVISKSLETAHLETKIKVGFDVPEDSVGKIREIITSIQSYGVEGEAALEGVRKQFALNGDLTDKQNEKIIKSAAVIANSYADIDFTELIQESNEFAEAIGVGQDDALAMTNALLKMGFPPDQLDIMSEYGSQLKRAGYNAQEIQGIFSAGINTKSWSIDVLLDGVKEGRIRLAEFGQGVDKTTAGLIKGTTLSAEKLQEWGAAVAEGGDAGKIAFGEVTTALSKVDNENDRNAIGARLFGTLWEEQGKKITDTLAGANSKTGNLTENQKKLNQAIAEQNNDPQVRLNQALTDMQNKLAPLLASIAEFVGKVADWISKNPELAAGITAVTVALGIIIGVGMALIPVIAGIATAAGALEIAMLPFTLTVLAWIAVIGALIAIGVLLWKNWDKIVAAAKKDFGELKSIIIGAGKRIASEWKKATTDFKRAWDWIVKGLSNIGKNIKKEWDKAIRDVKTAFGKLKSWFHGIDLRKIGSDIIGGLIKGMSNMYEKVKTKAKDIAATVKQAIKDKLRLGSPSKETEEQGEDVGLGMVKGIHNSLGKVKSMSKQMAAAAIPSVTNNTTVLPGSGKALTVNLHSPKALDVREANKQFNRTLNRMSLEW